MVHFHTSRWQSLWYAVIVAVLLLSACAPTPVAAPGAGAGAPPSPKKVIIGYTASQTGKLSVESARQVNGLQLWMKQVNEAGGIKLADGTVVTFEARFYDDESNKERIDALYTSLVNDDKADFLISPYSSGLADVAAATSDKLGRILITAGAASDSTHQKGYTRVFQTYTPASHYLTGGVDLLESLDAEVNKIAIIHENDRFSTDVANALRAYAEAKNYKVVLFEAYASGTTDFAALVDKIAAAAPEAIMGGGHFADTSAFATQLHETGAQVKFLALLVAPAEPKFAELGDAALGVIGPSQWEPQAQYTAEAAQALDLEWYGPTVAGFTSAYQAAYGDTPSYHSAGGYAAGLILQKAIENAGSTDTAKVEKTLHDLKIMTFFGQIRFDSRPAIHGLQVGHEMVFIQWQQDQAGKLAKQVIWPDEGKSAAAQYPMP